MNRIHDLGLCRAVLRSLRANYVEIVRVDIGHAIAVGIRKVCIEKRNVLRVYDSIPILRESATVGDFVVYER